MYRDDGNDTPKMSAAEVRHERFCRGVAAGLLPSDAYKRAGYAAAGASNSAHRLLRLERIRTRIKQLVEEEAVSQSITPAKVIAELARVAFSDIRGLVDWRSERTEETDNPDGGDVLVIRHIHTNLVSLRSASDISPDMAAAIAELRQGADGQLTIKLHSKVKALELLAKAMGMMVERKEIGQPGEFDKLSLAEKRARAVMIARELGLDRLGDALPLVIAGDVVGASHEDEEGVDDTGEMEEDGADGDVAQESDGSDDDAVRPSGERLGLSHQGGVASPLVGIITAHNRHYGTAKGVVSPSQVEPALAHTPQGQVLPDPIEPMQPVRDHSLRPQPQGGVSPPGPVFETHPSNISENPASRIAPASQSERHPSNISENSVSRIAPASQSAAKVERSPSPACSENPEREVAVVSARPDAVSTGPSSQERLGTQVVAVKGGREAEGFSDQEIRGGHTTSVPSEVKGAKPVIHSFGEKLEYSAKFPVRSFGPRNRLTPEELRARASARRARWDKENPEKAAATAARKRARKKLRSGESRDTSKGEITPNEPENHEK